MTFPVATKNHYLDGQPFTAASVHTAYPGTTGSSEATGGTPAYARQALTVAAASGGSRLSSNAPVFDVAAGTYSWFGFWNGTVFVDAVPNGGFSPKNFISKVADSKIHAEGHGYANDTKVVFYHGTPATPLVEGTTYFVVNSATNEFQVAPTLAGAAITLTGITSFGCVVCQITEQVHAVQGTHTLTSFSDVVPD